MTLSLSTWPALQEKSTTDSLCEIRDSALDGKVEQRATGFQNVFQPFVEQLSLSLASALRTCMLVIEKPRNHPRKAIGIYYVASKGQRVSEMNLTQNPQNTKTQKTQQKNDFTLNSNPSRLCVRSFP